MMVRNPSLRWALSLGFEMTEVIVPFLVPLLHLHHIIEFLQECRGDLV